MAGEPAMTITRPFIATTNDTRSAAAIAIMPALGKLGARVEAFIRNRGPHGASDEEVSEALNMKLDTARARRVELRDAGLVVDTGVRRATHTGRRAVCWVAAHRPSRRPATGPTAAGPTPMAPTARSNPGPLRMTLVPPTPTGCWWCGRSHWWRSIHGAVVCGHCHPPAVPSLVAEWIDADAGREPETQSPSSHTAPVRTGPKRGRQKPLN